MLALRLTVFALLFCGTCGFSRFWFNLFNHCNPPEQLVGKFCAALLDNDVNGDGRVDGSDIGKDVLYYNYDDDLCIMQEWEVVARWTCRYGFSDQYGRFMYKLFDANQDGLATANDFKTFNFTNADFLATQYTRFKNMYCGDPKNREDPVDRVQCAEVNALKPEDVKCT
ncbi:uncharacterized protein LOC124138756 [Haliotis rufescens]|uniref:uncharacterized protein LOC124149015 n=1 Tax=Haliotis rufescens TaxID=6454 RepID=UPI001EAFA096|nr:uncharacterized protein LOC124149015 [Haliotis rufescens]XP_048245534.1 uncharacterized protein LOC124138756 [Haliotis rufescens]